MKHACAGLTRYDNAWKGSVRGDEIRTLVEEVVFIADVKSSVWFKTKVCPDTTVRNSQDAIRGSAGCQESVRRPRFSIDMLLKARS